MKWFKNAAGATAPTHNIAKAPMAAGKIFFHVGTGTGSAFTTGATFAAACGCADTCIGGGGNLISPPCVTVMLRTMTSSSFKTMLPSFSGVMSLAKLTKLVAYNCEDWPDKRLAKSV